MECDGKVEVGGRAVRVSRCDGERSKKRQGKTAVSKTKGKPASEGKNALVKKNPGAELKGAARRTTEKKTRWKVSGKTHKDGSSRAARRSQKAATKVSRE